MVQVKDRSSQADPDGSLEPSAWLAELCRTRPQGDCEVLRRASELAASAHGDQRRASGEPYLGHPFAVAEILADLNMDQDTLAAAILHDVLEDTAVTLNELQEQFGVPVARLVDGVTKMALVPEYASQVSSGGKRDSGHAESLRKMLLAMVEDVRVVLIKLADRLHNMRTLGHLPEPKRRRIARETLDIYAPLANRLGIWQIKWELEDLALRYLEPDSYRQIARLLDERRLDRERYIHSVVDHIQDALKRANIEGEVTGRPKHIFSIWRKMQSKGVDFDQIFDVRAVRILVPDLAACYGALGVVHSLWKHVPKEFDDYIATPKENLYQSLHTAVVGPQGKPLEVQIRTFDMHAHAELGVAAHWRYKDGSKFDAGFERKIAWLRQLLEWKDEEESARDFVNRFKAEVYADRVYVLTPKGSVLDLPAGATPLDFAYHIHTDVGHRCRGAKVNGRIVPLTYELKSGEQVEVLTTRHGGPSRDWLNPSLGYLRSSRARAKARAWFKHQNLDNTVASGRAVLERELHRLGLNDPNLEALAQKFKLEKSDDFFAAIGRGEITPAQIAGAAQEQVMPAPTEDIVARAPRRRDGDNKAADHITIHGVGKLLTTLARCCKPVPEDAIVGYITRGHGVTIHRNDCPNVLRFQTNARERLIEVSWGSDTTDMSYPVDVAILAYDRQGLLRDVSGVLANDKINVLSVNTVTDRGNMARMKLTLEISNVQQLSRVLTKIAQLSNVIEAHRQN